MDGSLHAAVRDGTILIHAPVPLHRRADGQLMLDGQACVGLRHWTENFARVKAIMPVAARLPGKEWVPIETIGPALGRIDFVEVPEAYRADRFLRALPAARRAIRAAIDEADYLSFAIGGLFGDWGAVACLEAHRMGRPYAVWTDRVESEVTRLVADGDGPWRARLRARLARRPMAMLERAVIRRAELGLFHGRETYEAYAPHCRHPEVVHDIAIAAEDHIGPAELAAKAAAVGEGPLRIAYVGRADAMKGPLDWIEVLERLASAGVDFRAVWLGDGAHMAEMRARVAATGLGDRVELPGFATDRGAVLATLRRSHLFLFCHKTPESPRCLIEALVSGCPIVGYDGAFARDLVSGHGGGRFVPRDDVAALAGLVGRLAADRAVLAGLIRAAAADGLPFSGEAVFRHRSEVIRAGLRR